MPAPTVESVTLAPIALVSLNVVTSPCGVATVSIFTFMLLMLCGFVPNQSTRRAPSLIITSITTGSWP